TGPGLHLVVQVLPDRVEGTASRPELDTLGHDGAFALVDEPDVDVLPEHWVVSLLPAPAILRPPGVLLAALLAGLESLPRSLADQPPLVVCEDYEDADHHL